MSLERAREKGRERDAATHLPSKGGRGGCIWRGEGKKRREEKVKREREREIHIHTQEKERSVVNRQTSK